MLSIFVHKMSFACPKLLFFVKSFSVCVSDFEELEAIVYIFNRPNQL